MTKRKKYPKLPNGFGSIRYLGSGRRNPYCVQPASTGLDINGCPIRPKPLCYVDSWYKGFAVLTAYNAGTYTEGMQNTLRLDDGATHIDDVVRNILSNYSLITQRIAGVASEKLTFAEIYEKAYNDKYNTGKTYSKSSKGKLNAAYRKCESLYSRPFEEIRYIDLQSIIDSCPLKKGSLGDLLVLFHMMYAYAIKMDLVTTDYSQHLTIKDAEEDEHGVPFSLEELTQLWHDVDVDPTAELLLIMCYSGHRISEYTIAEVNLKDGYFKGGVKTKTSRERIVPIHSAIYPLVKRRLRRDGTIINAVHTQRRCIAKYCTEHGMDHTPHDTRHTFSMLCEKYGVPENDRKRMLGHTFKDVTNAVYGHRTLEDLRTELEKIQFCPKI